MTLLLMIMFDFIAKFIFNIVDSNYQCFKFVYRYMTGNRLVSKLLQGTSNNERSRYKLQLSFRIMNSILDIVYKHDIDNIIVSNLGFVSLLKHGLVKVFIELSSNENDLRNVTYY